MQHGQNSQPSDNGSKLPLDSARLEDALHFAKKHEQRVWGSGTDHEKASAEVERLESLLSANSSPLLPSESPKKASGHSL